MMCKGGCDKLCPLSLAISLGLTFMLCLWVMLMWSTNSSSEAATAWTSHMMAGLENIPLWQLYLGVFLKGAFVGIFIALFYDLCRAVANKVCRRSCGSSCCCTTAACPCNCACCSKKK